MAAVSGAGKFMSLGKECAAYNCSSRSYYIQNNERKPTEKTSLTISTDHLGEQDIHLRKDQDLYFTIGITLKAT